MDGGNEIGKKIEAEERIRKLVRCGSDNRFQLCD